MFLPEDYKSPKISNYMKFQDGENKIRILSAPIYGWEDWKDKKPYRFRSDKKPASPMEPGGRIKHFWSLIVWNHKEEQIQILHLTQETIRKSIENFSKDADWGMPYNYDIKITKSGTGIETKYVTIALPHKPVHEHIRNSFYEKRINLEAIFADADPFSAEWKEYTPGMFEIKSASIKLREVA